MAGTERFMINRFSEVRRRPVLNVFNLAYLQAFS
jgi:hypothetical protein